MYPTLFRIGTFEITSFGVLVAIGALVGLWIFGRELARSGLPEDATNAAVAGVIGGLVGAKLLWTLEHHGEDQLLSLLLSRGGMSWFGGFVGGVGAGLAAMRIQRLPIVPVLAAATPALAIGQAIGRIGCFLVGDDYGRPTGLPWGVAFPKGLPPTDVPVHPTQLYECAALVVLFVLLLRWRRAGVSDAAMIGRYLALAGVVRFAIEFLRVNVRVLGPFTVAGLASIGITIIGVLILLRAPAARPVTRSRTAS
ncbi:MAG TPA: prolipoprotein diacylglyceryl transferase family protein [Vicinamibacterales bacterium]|nr:prolipoprotein diacylglyceryl transferase family protein [Vicinamibacterales bacterium]